MNTWHWLLFSGGVAASAGVIVGAAFGRAGVVAVRDFWGRWAGKVKRAGFAAGGMLESVVVHKNGARRPFSFFSRRNRRGHRLAKRLAWSGAIQRIA